MTAEVTPRSAVVGQQVLYRVRIVRREDVARVEWVVQPGFPGFRAEWLPGRPEDTDMRYRGVRYFAREEQRALFPVRAGPAATAPASIRCTLERAGPRPAESHVVEVPPVSLRVTQPPERGRPAEFDGVIGPVRVTTIVDPLEISLGRSIAVSVSARGRHNLWDVAAPLQGREQLDGAEIFASPPDLELGQGEQLQLDRYFRYEIVPRREGSFVFPAVEVPYYDPDTGRYEVARSEAVQVRVRPRAAVTPQPPRPKRRKGPPVEPTGFDSTTWGLSLVLATAVAGFAAFYWRRRSNDPWQRVDLAIAEADTAASGGDPIAEADALRRAVGHAVRAALPDGPDADPAPLRALASSDPLLGEVSALLESLDWIRFSGELGHPDRRAALDAVDALRTRGTAANG